MQITYMDGQCVKKYLLANLNGQNLSTIQKKTKNYDENSKYGATLEVDVEYPIRARIKHENLAFLPERRKINGIEKLVTTLSDKEK